MKKYIIKFGLFIGLVSLLPIMILVFLKTGSYQPLMTNSLSFDTKLNHIIQADLGKLDIMVHGSSIALNNFHSETFDAHLSEELDFYNFSSWNLNMENNALLLDVFTDRYEPELVVLPACQEDFQKTVVELCPKSDIHFFLDDYFNSYFYLRNFDLFNILRRKKNVDEFRRESVKDSQKQYFLDDKGGVALSVSKEKLNMKRWNKDLTVKIDTSQYTYLEEICKTLKRKNISFAYVQTPMKKDNCLTAACQEFQRVHQAKVKKILDKYDQTYIDLYTGNPYPDSLFCDEIHLNKLGPIRFTQELSSKLSLIHGEIVKR